MSSFILKTTGSFAALLLLPWLAARAVQSNASSAPMQFVPEPAPKLRCAFNIRLSAVTNYK